MKIAVIGAKGMLGSELCRVLGAAHEMLAWDIAEIDITDRVGTLERLGAARPDLIINSAALVNVETCESDPDRAWRINAVGAQNLALAAQQTGSALLYISTDYIFDGQTETAYDEVALPNPLNQYGRSKLAGERLSLQICARTYSIRTAWIFGHAPNNYVARVLQRGRQRGCCAYVGRSTGVAHLHCTFSPGHFALDQHWRIRHLPCYQPRRLYTRRFCPLCATSGRARGAGGRGRFCADQAPGQAPGPRRARLSSLPIGHRAAPAALATGGARLFCPGASDWLI